MGMVSKKFRDTRTGEIVTQIPVMEIKHFVEIRTYVVQTETTVTDQDIADWVTTAFEGGVSYWCPNAEAVVRNDQGQWVPMSAGHMRAIEEAATPNHLGYPVYALPHFWDNDKVGYRLTDDEGEVVPKVLTLAAVLKAFKYQPKQTKGTSGNWFRKICDRLISEDYDADDADNLVQVAVFGEVVYG